MRADSAILNNLSYGVNLGEVLRFGINYDQALVTEKLSGYDHTYFSGAGLDLEMNGPWDNTRIRIETGYPVVAHGVKGLTLNFNFLKVF